MAHPRKRRLVKAKRMVILPQKVCMGVRKADLRGEKHHKTVNCFVGE